MLLGHSDIVFNMSCEAYCSSSVNKFKLSEGNRVKITLSSKEYTGEVVGFDKSAKALLISIFSTT